MTQWLSNFLKLHDDGSAVTAFPHVNVNKHTSLQSYKDMRPKTVHHHVR